MDKHKTLGPGGGLWDLCCFPLPLAQEQLLGTLLFEFRGGRGLQKEAAAGSTEEDEEEGVIVCKEGKHNRWMTRADAERAVRNDITGKTYILNDVASPPTSSEAKEPVISKRPLEDLKGDLKKLSHKRCRLGQANRNTIYFEAWARTSGDRDEHASSRYMTNGTTKLGVRKTVLK